jgi:mannose-6-phosphate isomerase-like protein (cupin superfamily)
VDPALGPDAATHERTTKITPVGEEEKAAPGEGEPDFLGEHATETVDFVVVLSGEITLTIGGREETLRAGETVVQQATPHDWVNRGTEPCVLAGILVSTRA